MLNVEIDDYGTIEMRGCGCPLEDLGYTQHLSNILSFSKLTGEGVTLIGSDMIRILEEVLPARFGGSSLDYQLLEEEDDSGLTRLNLLVSPKIQLQDDKSVTEAVMNSLAQLTPFSQSIWDQAETIRIKRMKPIWSERGKCMPLLLGKRLKGTRV